MITVEKAGTDFRVTIPQDAVPRDRLNALIDWLRLEEIVQRSQIVEQEADRLAEDIKAEWWAANKGRFIPPDRQ